MYLIAVKNLTTQNYLTTESMESCRKCQFSDRDLAVQSRESSDDRKNSRQLCYQQTICQGSHDMAQTGHTYRQLCPYLMFPRLPALAWLSSDTCSLATLLARICVVLCVLVLMITPSSAAPVSTETILAGAGTPPLGEPCHAGFVGQLHACIRPFLSRVAGDRLKDPRTLVQHLCLEYQLGLLCVHSALTKCPGADSLRQVQTTLGSHHVIHVNHLCSISSHSSTRPAESHTHPAESPTRPAESHKRTLTKHTHGLDLSGGTNISQQRSGDIVQTTTHRHGVYTAVTQPQSPSPRTSLGSVTTTWPSDQEQRLDGRSYDMQLNIYDFVNNYQDDQSPAQDRGPSRTFLFQVMAETSAGGVTLSHPTLMFVVGVAWALASH